MKYYKIILKYVKYNPLVWIDPLLYNDLGWGDYDLQKCKYIKDWDKRNTVFFKDFEIAEDRTTITLPAPCISQKLKDILENDLQIKWVQYLPIRFQHKTKSDYTIDWYYVLNILNLLDEAVIDKEKSMPDWLGTYFNIVFFEDKIDCDIFRIKTYEVAFFISERFKKAIYPITKSYLAFREVKYRALNFKPHE